MIESFTGLPGAGKTYNMVRRAYQQHKQGRAVYANFECSFATRFTELNEIYEVQDALILLDEAGIYLPAQAWKEIPFEFIREIRQHRKNGLDFWYTAQDKMDVCTALRRVTQFENKIDRTWKFCTCTTYLPNKKNRMCRTFHILNSKVFDLFDTNCTVEFSKFVKTSN